MSTVARSVVEAKPCVICDGGSMHMLLELEAKLLHFEPYADLGEDIPQGTVQWGKERHRIDRRISVWNCWYDCQNKIYWPQKGVPSENVRPPSYHAPRKNTPSTWRGDTWARPNFPALERSQQRSNLWRFKAKTWWIQCLLWTKPPGESFCSLVYYTYILMMGFVG